LDKTKTSSGSNMMYDSILKPLNDIKEIKQRQEFIEEFLKEKILLDKIRQEL
jgi:mutS domain III